MSLRGRIRIFFSYARADGETLANRLYDDLKQNGFEVWLDTRDIPPGSSWPREIEKALGVADVVLIILTPGFCESDTCLNEVVTAYALRKQVIPLLAVVSSPIPFLLRSRHHIDFSAESDYSRRLKELLAALQRASVDRQQDSPRAPPESRGIAPTVPEAGFKIGEATLRSDAPKMPREWIEQWHTFVCDGVSTRAMPRQWPRHLASTWKYWIDALSVKDRFALMESLLDAGTDQQEEIWQNLKRHAPFAGGATLVVLQLQFADAQQFPVFKEWQSLESFRYLLGDGFRNTSVYAVFL